MLREDAGRREELQLQHGSGASSGSGSSHGSRARCGRNERNVCLPCGLGPPAELGERCLKCLAAATSLRSTVSMFKSRVYRAQRPRPVRLPCGCWTRTLASRRASDGNTASLPGSGLWTSLFSGKEKQAAVAGGEAAAGVDAMLLASLAARRPWRPRAAPKRHAGKHILAAAPAAKDQRPTAKGKRRPRKHAAASCMRAPSGLQLRLMPRRGGEGVHAPP